MAGSLLLGMTALICAVLAPPAQALELGRMQVHSALYQELDAEIPLVRLDRLPASDITVQLSANEEFERLGILRDSLLDSLSFTVRAKAAGEPVIHIGSAEPLAEPFLHFLLEVRWPDGRLQREYTLLLDPLDLAEDDWLESSPATPAEAPVSARSTPAAPVASAGDDSERTDGPERTGGQVYTAEGDTLWSLAVRLRPSARVSVHQVMLALQQANPDAFLDGNINRMKIGYLLLIPEEFEMTALDPRQAVVQVRDQHDNWRDDEVAPADETTARPHPEENPGDIPDGGEAASEPRPVASASPRLLAAPGRISELEKALAATRADLESSRRANEEFKARLTELGEQIQVLNRLVQEQGDELTRLREQLRQVREEGSVFAVDFLPRSLWMPVGLGVLLTALIGMLVFLSNRRRIRPREEEAGDKPETAASETAATAGDEEAHADQVASLVVAERFKEAASLLQAAIDAAPGRVDLRLALLEVHGRAGDADAFERELQRLTELGDEEANARALALREQLLTSSSSEASAAPDASGAPGLQGFDEAGNQDDRSFNLDRFGGNAGQSVRREPAAEDDDEEAENPVERLYLARTYIDMGDLESARNLLLRIMEQGSLTEQQEARRLLDRCNEQG